MDQSMIAALTAKAAKTKDHSDTSAGGDFEYQVPDAGQTLVRFVDYIEIGMQPQRPFQGKEKPPAREVWLGFELVANKHIRTGNEDQKWLPKIMVKVTEKTGEKATFFKLFNKMRYGRDGFSHMSQFLGEHFKATVVHNKVKKEGKETVYANLRTPEGEWTLAAPLRITDEIEGTSEPIQVPAELLALEGEMRLFLWDMPNQQCWDAIFIDGESTYKNDKGEEVTVSRNRFQNSCLKAVDYEGSALHAMLGGVEDLPTEEPEDVPTTEQDTPAEEPDTAAPSESEKPTGGGADDLAALGLV